MVGQHNILFCQNILNRNCVFQYIFPIFQQTWQFYVRSSVSIPIEIGPHPTPPHQQHPPLSLHNTTPIPSEIGPKQLRAEMT